MGGDVFRIDLIPRIRFGMAPPSSPIVAFALQLDCRDVSLQEESTFWRGGSRQKPDCVQK